MSVANVKYCYITLITVSHFNRKRLGGNKKLQNVTKRHIQAYTREETVVPIIAT